MGLEVQVSRSASRVPAGGHPVLLIHRGLVWFPATPEDIADMTTADLVTLSETGRLPSPFERAMVRGLMQGFGFTHGGA